ncbi:MAG TPA: hypothetical protein VKF82_12230 [Candidatus Eremiobacteraceae bacterium]|nr:hypothetical protein [Candidatus Eremiobacteraceae bacterium]
MRAVAGLIALTALALVALVAVRALGAGHESGAMQAAQTVAAFVAALAGAIWLRCDDALTRSAITVGGILVCAGFALYEASQGLYDVAALPLASAGTYVLLAGCATATYTLIAGIPEGQRRDSSIHE